MVEPSVTYEAINMWLWCEEPWVGNPNPTISHQMMITQKKEKGQNLKKAAQVQLLNGLDVFSFGAERS